MHRSPYRECPMASTADGLGRAGPMCGLLTAILRCLEKIRAFGDYQHMPQVGSLQSPTPSLRFVRGCNPCTHQSAPHSPRGVEAIEETDRPLQHSINDAPSSPFLPSWAVYTCALGPHGYDARRPCHCETSRCVGKAVVLLPKVAPL